MKNIILAVGASLVILGCKATNSERVQSVSQLKTAIIKAPDANIQTFPTDLRRTSLIVDNIEESLKLYRDILGFKVNYDTVVPMSGKALPAGEAGAKARLVLISSNDSWVGWIGLLQWLEPALPRPAQPRRVMGIGDAILVFNTEKVDEHCEAVEKLEGVYITAPASNTTYPARAGGDPIIVRTCYLFDRDGYFLELNKIMDRDNYNKN